MTLDDPNVRGGLPARELRIRTTERHPEAAEVNATTYLAEIPNRMRVQFREPDSPAPAGDEDYRTQMVAGVLPGEERIWILTVDDAVRYITKGRISLFVKNGAGEIPVHVSTSSRGRRYVRTDPDAGAQNNLRNLPPVNDLGP